MWGTLSLLLLLDETILSCTESDLRLYFKAALSLVVMAVIVGWHRSLAREGRVALRGETGADIFPECYQRRLFLFGNMAVESLSLWYCGGLTFPGSCQYLPLALSRAILAQNG